MDNVSTLQQLMMNLKGELAAMYNMMTTFDHLYAIFYKFIVVIEATIHKDKQSTI